MLAHLFEDRRVSRADLKALRALLEEAERNTPPRPRSRKEPRP